MREFTARGGWWVAVQFGLLGAIAAAWWVWSADWGPLAVAAGWAAAGAGVVLGGWGLVALGGNLTPYPSPRSDARLVERGPYRLVRHPIYGGIVMGTGGISLADGNAAGLTLALGLIVLFLGKSEFEEERLLSRFPAYGEYRERVPRRLVPWIL